MKPVVAPLVVLVLTLGAIAHAETPARPRGVPAILADHVAAIGGKAPFRRHRTLHLVRKVSIKGMGIEGTEERWLTATNQQLVVTKMPGVGTIRQGSDGKLFWSEDPINGLRLLTGAEAEQAAIDGRWSAELELEKLYKTITPVAPPADAPTDVPLECLTLTKPLGQAITTCFDARTHLRVLLVGRQASPQGDIPYVAQFSEYRAFGGVKLPTLEVTRAGPSQFEARLVSATFDEPLPADRFEIPAAVLAQIKADAATTPTTSTTPSGAKPAAPARP